MVTWHSDDSDIYNVMVTLALALASGQAYMAGCEIKTKLELLVVGPGTTLTY